ncbi:MAG: tetratricopeptide repeat protein [Treponema sp.]|jgi:tetratricopeptide (TPR) repeat protein|nr:tetratricopeptide repeat protein [Treponema sp.]
MKRGKLIFITVPEALRRRFVLPGAAFDPAEALPVELPPGRETLAPEELEVEMFLSGLLLYLAGDPRGASADYYRSLVAALRPGVAAELEDAALVKARGGDYEAAQEILRILEGLNPGGSPGFFLNAALIRGDRAAALEKIAPKKPAADAALAEAEAAWEKALDHPLRDTFYYAALFYRDRGDYAKTAAALRAYLAAEENEENEENRENGENENESGEPGGAGGGDHDEGGRRADMARKLLEEIQNHGLEDPSFREALVLIRRGEEKRGIAAAKEFLERRPGAARGWFVLGWGLRRLSRWEDGAACFEKAVELGCANADTRNELAICRMETGDFAEARRQLERALREDPDNVKIISNMGVLAMKEGDGEGAAAFFRTVLELEPEDPLASAFLSRFP